MTTAPEPIDRPTPPVAVIGAGPAGLTAANELAAHAVPVVVLEQDRQIGGLAKTVEYRGFRFDIGGHRFFTRQQTILTLWQSLLGDDLLVRPRQSRILYGGRYFNYPLRLFNTLRNLGIAESCRILVSYLQARLSPIRPEASLADWVTNRFGRRLFELFFKSYTEKVWGISCDEIRAQWAAQRIRGLSLRTAALAMLLPAWRRGGRLRTLTDRFYYPSLGPGMMWDALATRITAAGGMVCLESPVVAIHHDEDRLTRLVSGWGSKRAEWEVSRVIATMPLRTLVRRLIPPPPPEIVAAADRLRYRDFLTVALVVDAPDLFPDNWLYIHDETVRVGRIQNYRNWSVEMVPDRGRSFLGMEYFCFAGDELWEMEDAELVALAKEELVQLGLATAAQVSDGTVVRMPKAYPVYDEGFEEAVSTIRAYLDRFRNLQVIGRNGMHRYNNMDHSMLTGLLAARNLLGENHDPWLVNVDGQYHEEDIG